MNKVSETIPALMPNQSPAPTSRPTGPPTLFIDDASLSPSQWPSLLPSEAPSIKSTVCGYFRGDVTGNFETRTKHADDGNYIASCGTSFDYRPFVPDLTSEEPNAPPYVLEDFGRVTGPYAEDTCVTITFVHDRDDASTCRDVFLLNAYSGTYDDGNKDEHFLGYGDYYWASSFSVIVPRGSALHLVSESYWTTESDDGAGDPCYLEVIIDDGSCSN